MLRETLVLSSSPHLYTASTLTATPPSSPTCHDREKGMLKNTEFQTSLSLLSA
ncbi:hypothetical protein GBAR_LOCUS703 [Geodia barretti]|uniref:Uncharacterized protein n=1 Tax=Geodia barretti TaxID=519541 RepID=A0AA35QTN8_GEOBA|nr:hypothetical protein GBAR_LOCUS703 [Geodia barretti]